MTTTRGEGPSIWWWAFGYFAAYAPYAALTKVVTSGLATGGDPGPPPGGVQILPLSVASAVVTAALFLVATGWWRHAVPAGKRWPRPTLATVLSGLCSAGIIATTTLAYTFEGISIVFVMLLMRGGLLILAPLIDAITGRHVRWFSWLALALSIASLLVATGRGSTAITTVCAIDVGLYLACYFVRLNLMSRLAKSSDPGANARYFVEEQLVSSPSLLVGLVAAAVIGRLGVDEAVGLGSIATLDAIAAGFTAIPGHAMWPAVLVIGILSQGTGIFGGLILLDRRENTFCVPVNRASSVLAGVVGSYGLVVLFAARPPSDRELLGALLIILAIVALTVPPAMQKRRQRRAVGAAVT
jgi:hypothetical protein